MIVYIMSGVQTVRTSSFANDLRNIFDTLSYGPAPEADNVAQVVVYFNCHVLFRRRSRTCCGLHLISLSLLLCYAGNYGHNPPTGHFAYETFRLLDSLHLDLSPCCDIARPPSWHLPVLCGLSGCCFLEKVQTAGHVCRAASHLNATSFDPVI